MLGFNLEDEGGAGLQFSNVMRAVSTTSAPPWALRSSVQSLRNAVAFLSQRAPALRVRTTQQPVAEMLPAPLQRKPAPSHNDTQQLDSIADARSVT